MFLTPLVSAQTLMEDVNELKKGFEIVIAENSQQQNNFVLFISFWGQLYVSVIKITLAIYV